MGTMMPRMWRKETMKRIMEMAKRGMNWRMKRRSKNMVGSVDTMDVDVDGEEDEAEDEVVGEVEMETEMVGIGRMDSKKAQVTGKYGRRSNRLLEGMMRRLQRIRRKLLPPSSRMLRRIWM